MLVESRSGLGGRTRCGRRSRPGPSAYVRLEAQSPLHQVSRPLPALPSLSRPLERGSAQGIGRRLRALKEMQLGPAHRNAPYRPLRPRNEVPAVPGAHVVALETGQHPPSLCPPPARRPEVVAMAAGGEGARSPKPRPIPCSPAPVPQPRPPCRPRCCCRGSARGSAGLWPVQLRCGSGAETREQCQAQAKKGWAVHSGCGAEAQHGRLGPHLPTAPASLGEQAPRTGGRAA